MLPVPSRSDELDKINRDVDWYLHDIEMRFASSLHHANQSAFISIHQAMRCYR